MASTHDSAVQTPLRLWPGVTLVVIQWLARFVLPVVAPATMPFAVMGSLLCGVLVVVWWLFLSRAPWAERAGVLLALIVGFLATMPLLHVSVGTGNMGFMFPIYAIPLLSLGLVLWAAFGRQLAPTPRWLALGAVVLVACGSWTLVRTGGNTTDFTHDFAWRWTPTPEDELLAAGDETMVPLPAADVASSEPAPAAWPGFRGPDRDSRIQGIRIATDWSATPPAELWRRPVGPGWSSFAVSNGVFFTQEQRGEDELVACYRTATGDPVWRHRDPARFWESVGGAGPRGTPTLHEGWVITLGATGIVNVLEAVDGTLVWSADAAADTGAKLPGWGFSGSPLVVDDKVVVAASGSLIAYDLATGEERWQGPAGGEGYSSPHLVTVDGVEQVLQIDNKGLAGYALDGSVLWKHEWGGYPIVQPAVTADGDVLYSAVQGGGIRRLAISQASDGWNVEERWASRGLKPYFNDFVVHEGHVYGFDNSIMAAIDVETGERKWKGGRYGGGQLVLLADQDVLLVLSEKGELALVKAEPEGFEEIAKVPAIEGKTWNHPVLVDDVLLVRNAEEMAAFKLQKS